MELVFTDLVDGCKSAGLPIPEVVDEGGWFTLTIWRKAEKSSLKSSLKILEILEEDPYCTYDSLAEIIGVSRRAITKQIQKLRKEGTLCRVGPDKGGYWEVRKV